MRFWSDLPADLRSVLVIVVAALLLAGGTLLADLWDARNAMLLSEKDTRDLKRDQFRTESRRRLRRLQERLGLRRVS